MMAILREVIKIGKLISRKLKKVFKTKIGGHIMNFPKEAVDKFGENYEFDIYEDKIIMTPLKKEV